MVELTGDASACCAAELQRTCCEPSEKAGCCGHGEDCACDAGATAAEAEVREQAMWLDVDLTRSTIHRRD